MHATDRTLLPGPPNPLQIANLQALPLADGALFSWSDDHLAFVCESELKPTLAIQVGICFDLVEAFVIDWCI